jgi:hypothetical protein
MIQLDDSTMATVDDLTTLGFGPVQLELDTWTLGYIIILANSDGHRVRLYAPTLSTESIAYFKLLLPAPGPQPYPSLEAAHTKRIVSEFEQLGYTMARVMCPSDSSGFDVVMTKGPSQTFYYHIQAVDRDNELGSRIASMVYGVPHQIVET